MYRFCTCKKDRGLDIGMIGCDNQSCSNGTWFHVDCVNIDKIPDGKWFCSQTCEKSSKEAEDHKLNYNTRLLLRGLNDKIRRTAVRNGDGPAMIRFWKLFHINHHPKYFILAHRLIAGMCIVNLIKKDALNCNVKLNTVRYKSEKQFKTYHSLLQ
ncbi:ING3 [Mytilus coruscus]|uniref:ING3 n=1 Tax=Mytilus coruscus TaxID=42192 RepID=A0A6J8CDN8_MYTCO|nr:ING3 [Mytilus coruscus]